MKTAAHFAGLALWLCSALACAEVYKCPGANGVPVYQAEPCAAGVDTGIRTEPEPDDLYVPPPRAPYSYGNGSAEPARDEHGRIVRSESAKNDFKRMNPCPTTGARSGPCPGYVIDHVKALACGGADAPGNMQWQTVAAGHAKDAWERDGCEAGRGGGVSPPVPSASSGSAYTPGITYTGPRGGRFHYSGSGRKVYEKH